MPSKNVISWTSLIDGYNYNDSPFEALSVFKEMESKLVEPDEVTLLGLVSICSKLGSFEKAQWADEYIQKRGCEPTIHITNALIDMHAKCGNIEKACRIFDRTVNRTLVTWTTMIQGLGVHGHGIEALVRFSQMQREGFKPDAVLFLCTLCACSHAGLVDEGINCFRSMTEDYSIVPWMDHYGSLVDLLCRAQQVDKAFQFVERMNSEPDERIWRALLRACKEKGDFVVARKLIIRLLDLEPQYSGNYVLASNLFAATGEWDEVKRIREEMSSARVAKTDSAYSFVELATFQH
ncbi:pentatricopeptide repeat-containing protein At4g21065-like [Aristolochia californica]|uniref:pentatricopeptide repeat-containing protein At4g21065-like n=1 Tax=Aristolochia californica TaxID=171875 RepID=UPI0035D7F2B3